MKNPLITILSRATVPVSISTAATTTIAPTASSTAAAIPTAPTAAPPVAATTTTTAAAFLTRARFGNRDVTPIYILSIQPADRGLCFFRLGHGDKREAARTPRYAIRNEIDVLYNAVRREEVLKT